MFNFLTSTSTKDTSQSAWLRHLLLHLFPGIALSCVIAMAATFVFTLYGGPQILYALFFGFVFHYLSHDLTTRPGIEFCSRAVLRLGVGMLGARITASQIAGLGWSTAAIVITAVVTTMLCGVMLGRYMGFSRAQAVLSGGSVAICGASAALAISTVLPRNKDSERFTLIVVVTVTVLSTIAMVIYPLAAKLLRLPPELTGLFLGGSIHDVAQVVGAGYMLSQETGDYATIVKLFRVSMLALVVVVVSTLFKRAREASEFVSIEAKQPLVPWFLVVFGVLVITNSVGGLPTAAVTILNDISRGCLVVAIAALGVKTSFMQLAQAGWLPFALILVETLWMASFVLVAILLRN